MMTPRKLAFVDHYVTSLNAASAAKAAGYSARSAKQTGSRLLTDHDVQEALRTAQQRAHDQAGITTEMITRELGRLAFANMTDIIHWDSQGKLVITASDDLPEAVKAAIAEVSEHIDAKGQRFLRVKLHSKTTAIELLTRQRIDEDHERRLAELEAKINRLGRYANLHESLGVTNGYASER